jgi:hypothetical protein
MGTCLAATAWSRLALSLLQARRSEAFKTANSKGALPFHFWPTTLAKSLLRFIFPLAPRASMHL